MFLKSELSRDVFFYFLIPFSAKTPSFESISGRPSSKKTPRVLPGPPRAPPAPEPPRAHSSGLGRLSGRLASRIHATLSATCMRPSQQPLQGGPKPSKTIGVLVILKKVVAKTLVVLHFSISESATLQSFLLLLFSKCQHSNDFIVFFKNTPKTRYCHNKSMFLAATDLKMIRKHNDFIVCLQKNSKIIGVVTFGKQK